VGLCINSSCLHVGGRSDSACPACGNTQLASINRRGVVTGFPAGVGMPCGRCGSDSHQLKFRYYKRVVGLLLMDRIHGAAGYFCPSCRRSLFAKHLLLTAIFGWWGIIALYFRNPLAITVNIWALFAPPLGALSYGAISVATLSAAARDGEDATQQQYEPAWWMPADLTASAYALITADVDYYATLGVPSTSPPNVLRSAHRSLLKKHHPDVAGDDAHGLTVTINAAYEVLGNPRLRAAYDGYRASLATASSASF
jgi:hypothetical protein